MMVMMGRLDVATECGTGSRDFLAVYRRAVGDVYSYLASRVGDRCTAEDLTQEVFIAGARRFAAGGTVDVAWLLAVGRNKLIDHWRSQGREDRKLALVRGVPASPHDEEMPATVDPGVATSVLARLNPTYRAALVLRHVDELSVPEVATHLGRTIEATEQVLARARAAFRRAYSEVVS
jgi:RNA polymerase sigma-70 factor (ECF subfamily)